MVTSCIWILVLVGYANAQFGGTFGVGSGCFTSMNCGGNSICQNQRCSCPSNYQQFGQSCMGGFSGGFGGGYGGGFGGGYGGQGQAITLVVQPGGSCGGGFGSMCGGGSSCNQGYCSCPQNFVQSGSTCIPQSIVYPGQSCNQYQQCGGGSYCQNNVCCCPGGFTGTSNGCIGGQNFGYGGFSGGYNGGFGGGQTIQITIYPGQSCGGGIGTSCGGGSSCNQGYCTCPPNCVIQNNQCQPYGGGIGSFGGYNNYNSFNMPYQSFVQLGGYCSQQSQCGGGGQCQNNVCQCGSGYYPQGGGCYRKKFYRVQPKKAEKEADAKSKPV